MVALVTPRKIIRRGGPVNHYSFGVKAGVAVIQSGLAMLDDGYLRPARPGQGADTAAQAADALTHAVVGVFMDSVTGGGADGAVVTTVESGEFLFANSASGDLITVADIGKPAYVVDDQTVAKTNATATRTIAGRITGVDAAGVWVRVGPGLAV